MKFLKTFNKLIEGVLWLYLPLILFYWAITPINLAFILPIKAILGKIIDPFVAYLETFSEFKFQYQNSDISYTPLVFAGVVLVIIILSIINARILELIEDLILDLKFKVTQKTMRKEKEKEWQSFQERLDKHKIIYLMLKVIKSSEHEQYLVRNDDMGFSGGLIDSYQTSIINLAKKFSAKEYNDYDAGADIYNFIFHDTEKFLQYLKVIVQKMVEINKGTAELNTIFSCQIAAGCSFSQVTIDTDLSLNSKILGLCNKQEVLITEVLKNKIQNSKTNFDLKIEPKGLYMLNDQSVDIFKLEVK